MKEIPLTQGKVALVDDADFDWLSQWKWCAHSYHNGKVWYAMRNVYMPDGRRGTLMMHRAVLGDAVMGIDHRDLNGLNNQRANLREASNTDNIRNRSRQRNNTSGYKGVVFDAGRPRPWIAQITRHGRRVKLGFFDTPEAAAQAYDAAVRELHGEFGRPNFAEVG